MGDGSGLAVSTFAGPSRDQPVRTKSAFLPSIDGALHATGAVLGQGARDLEFAHGVARLAPSGDGIKDDFYGGRSHLSEVHIASRLSLNSLALGLQKNFLRLQLSQQPVDFCHRRSSDFLNEWCDLRVSFRLRRKLCMREIANLPFSSQICG